MVLPGVDEDCGCSIFVLCWNWWWRSCWWLLETGSTTSSSKISSDLFPARLDSLTRIRLWRLRWILWKVCKRKRRISSIITEILESAVLKSSQEIFCIFLLLSALSTWHFYKCFDSFRVSRFFLHLCNNYHWNFRVCCVKIYPRKILYLYLHYLEFLWMFWFFSSY